MTKLSKSTLSTNGGFLQNVSFAGGAMAVFALALVLRLIVCAELAIEPAVISPLEVTDMATYKTLAMEIRHGNWPAFFDYQPFYYTVFLPLAYLFSPDGNPWPVLILQSLTGAATCLLAACIAARLFGKYAGWLAGLLLAISRFHIFYTPFLLLEVCFAFWTAAVLYCAIRALEDEKISWKWSALLGLSCAGALLTRGNALLWIPGLMALMAWKGWKCKRSTAVAFAAFALAFILPIAPYSIRNSMAKGHFCGPSVAGNKVLSLGNSPEAPAGGLEYPRTYYAWNDDEENGRQSVLSHIIQWAKEEPLAFLELEARSLLLFWDHTEIPNNVSIDVQGKSSHLLNLPILLPWGVLGTLGLAGLLLNAFKKDKKNLALTWMVLIYWAATSAFYLLARFRIGFLPILAVSGAGACSEIVDRVKTYRKDATAATKKRTAYAVGAIVLAFFIVVQLHDLYCQFVMPAVFRAIRPNGLSMEFASEKVVYDHGPLVFGGTITPMVPAQGISIEKNFVVPRIFHSAGPLRQTLLLRAFAPHLPEGTPAPATMTLDGTNVTANATWHPERSAIWLKFDFEAPVADSTTAHFRLFQAPYLKEWAFALDTQRNYARTKIDGEDFPAEAVAELVVPTQNQSDSE
ncbi:MAG: glycosyltransferase family 39 protein [Lentisphaeria bacterium]|nr:glycosyltransferase family 39 protein [Lentisphaeria bacterium]